MNLSLRFNEFQTCHIRLIPYMVGLIIFPILVMENK